MATTVVSSGGNPNGRKIVAGPGVSKAFRPGGLIGDSRPMREVYRLIAQAAPTKVPVLITGESGTGKELVARALHELGPNPDGAFVAVNAAAIPTELVESEVFGHEKGAFTGATERRAGCFELAHRGTLLLDEIAEMQLPLQAKLLRTLEDGRVRRLGARAETEVDTRVIAATNRDVMEAISGGRLRLDLYHRLNVFQIHLPPLRLRGDDLELLCEHFIELFNARHGQTVVGLHPDALKLLRGYPWPGNVRELRNVIERAVVLAGRGSVEPLHLPRLETDSFELRGDQLKLPVGISVAEAEKHLILHTLEAVQNNKAAAARQLGIDVKTIRSKLRSYAQAKRALKLAG